MPLIRLTLICLLTLIVQGCSKSPEESLISLLENNYANLYVNEKHKREVIEELNDFLQENELTDKNFPEIKKIIHKLQDGHVELYPRNYITKTKYLSGLEFHPGSDFVKSCLDCTPQVPVGKYKILKINNLRLKDYLAKEQFSVTASTLWGRNYRIIRSLTHNSKTPETSIKLLNIKNEIIKTKLNWKEQEKGPSTCLSGERISRNVFKLNILSLWCDDKNHPNETRQQVLKRFKDQFDNVASNITTNDFIILDLRENGGGSDLEVEYVLNSFSESPMFMYKYQYLLKNYQTTKSRLKNFLFLRFPLWDEVEYLYSNPTLQTKFNFSKNKMVTLISPGCFSSCEGLASSFKFENRSILIGNTTHGGAGDPVAMTIPGVSYLINIPTCLAWQKDNNLIEGHGVLADREIGQDFSDELDTVLNFVIRNIKSF